MVLNRGCVLGWPEWLGCGIVAFLVVVCVREALFPPPRRKGPSYALGSLKTIQTAQTLFREGDKDEDGTLDYGTLPELSNATLVDALLGGGKKFGYEFAVRPSATSPDFFWFAVANPVEPGRTGDRYFCTNHLGVIHYTTARRLEVTEGGPECAIPAGLPPLGK